MLHTIKQKYLVLTTDPDNGEQLFYSLGISEESVIQTIENITNMTVLEICLA